MSKPPRGAAPANWSRKLSRPLSLADGTRILTLADAANVVIARFGTDTRWHELEIAIEMLIAAAKSDKPADAKKATVLLQRVLRAQRLL
jgi:hypothetical protein